MKEKIITDNADEQIKIVWTGERFAIIQIIPPSPTKVIVLNPREMMELIQFSSRLGEE